MASSSPVDQKGCFEMEMESERFERRLVEDFSGLRGQMVQFESGIRQDLAQLGAGLREEMAALGSNLRQEMATMGSGLRQDMAPLGSGLRDEIAAARVDLFKWCFFLWVGQLLAIGGPLAVMLRLTR